MGQTSQRWLSRLLLVTGNPFYLAGNQQDTTTVAGNIVTVYSLTSTFNGDNIHGQFVSHSAWQYNHRLGSNVNIELF